MSLQYKIDVIDKLKEKGYSSYKIRNSKLISEGSMSRIRRGDMVSIEVIDKLCCLLNLQPGDIIEYTKDA